MTCTCPASGPTLRLGGKLKIVAEFPEGEVAITNFSDVGEVKDGS